jgi:Domain of unknown function (DUF4394)/PEP-CTERM motif
MICTFNSILRAAVAIALLFAFAVSVHAQTGYGVAADGTLFRFDINSPNASAVVIGPLSGSLVTDAIDFRPSTNALYGIDVGPNTTQLYTINITTAVATPVGAAFNSSGVGYDLTGSQTFGFDFNPTTLQGDGSMRIRLVGTNNSNLRINSDTGVIAVDTPLAIGTNSPFVDGIAYSNNTANMGTGTTTLYDMDIRNNSLFVQNPPNTGALNLVGPFGFTINNSQKGIGFDIYTPPGTTGNQAYAVYQRPDAPTGGPLGAYLLYDVNLATGATTGGARVGNGGATPFDFSGGFAVAPGVPEPASLALFAIGAAGLFAVRRRAN